MRGTLLLALAVAGALLFGLPTSAFVIDDDERIYRVLSAEESRSSDPRQVQIIIDATRAPDPRLRAIAVRALGRLERPALIDSIARLLDDDDGSVRGEAANALGQAVWAPETAVEDIRRVSVRLADRLRVEPAATVRGLILQTLGRLEYSTDEDVRGVERTLVRYAGPSEVRRDPSGTSGSVSPRSIHERDGAVRGLSRLFARRPNVARVPAPETVQALSDAAKSTFPAAGAAMEPEAHARIRRLAVQTLGAAGALDQEIADAAFGDSDWQVRRLAVLHGATLPGGPARVLAALNDPAPQVRFEALRTLAQRDAIPCAPVVRLTSDPDAHVARRAVEALARACEEGPGELDFLLALAARASRAGARRWHVASAALGSLAARCASGKEGVRQAVACARAPEIVRSHASDPQWQVRMHAALPASTLGDLPTLRRLAADSHPNVRTAAIERLAAVKPREDEGLIIGALKSNDYQLVMTAAKALEHSRHPDAVRALRAAYNRLASARSDTARDTLDAISQALDKHGITAARDRVSSIRVSPFSDRELARLLAGPHRATITMASGDSFDLELLPTIAPATVARFVRLARRGVYDGLTFHRVEPNFVIQGGSPGENEYAGHDPYMRDEVGLVSHDRGTVGISTRGRDTGDAQIFINLADNPRLDHRYTVFARVVAGMDVVDAIVEGDTMSRVRVSR